MKSSLIKGKYLNFTELYNLSLKERTSTITSNKTICDSLAISFQLCHPGIIILFCDNFFGYTSVPVNSPLKCSIAGWISNTCARDSNFQLPAGPYCRWAKLQGKEIKLLKMAVGVASCAGHVHKNHKSFQREEILTMAWTDKFVPFCNGTSYLVSLFSRMIQFIKSYLSRERR